MRKNELVANTKTALQSSSRRLQKTFTLNYYRAIFAYFLLTSLLGGVILQALEKSNPEWQATDGLSFIDSFFMATSFMCGVGLWVVDFSRFTSGAQIFSMVIINVGGLVLVTLPVLFLKMYYIRMVRKRIALVNANNSIELVTQDDVKVPDSGQNQIELVQLDEAETPSQQTNEVTVLPETNLVFDKEYRAMSKLIRVVLLYYLVLHCFGIFLFTFYFSILPDHPGLMTNGKKINGYWWGVFHTFTAFANGGVSLNSDGLAGFLKDPFVLIVLASLVLLGNTGFPIGLRLCIWFGRRYSKDWVPYKYLLIHPRDVYTHLFAPIQTRTLALIWMCFIISEFIILCILDFSHPSLQGFSFGAKILVFGFLSATTRTAGFTTVDFSLSNYGVQVFYTLLMYVSAFPLVLTLKRSAKKRVQGKEMYAMDEEIEHAERSNNENRMYIKVKKQFFKPLLDIARWILQSLYMSDVTWLFLAIFLIASIETHRFVSDPNFKVFKILFELAGAYGTVGLSLGYPGTVTGFVAQLSDISKVVVIFVMLLGRCRGLPDSLDYAVDVKRFQVPEKKEINELPSTNEKELTHQEWLAQIQQLRSENESLKVQLRSVGVAQTGKSND